jgi:HSP20 family protein
MSLIRWSPFEEVEAMRRQMDRMLEQFVGGQGGQSPLLVTMPRLEVYTTDDDVVIKAELPGMEPADVQVEVSEESVHITGELKREEEVNEDNYHRTERQFGSFERVIPLPNRIKEGEAKATFKNGVLTIRAPLAEVVKKPQARKLAIES